MSLPFCKSVSKIKHNMELRTPTVPRVAIKLIEIYIYEL